MILFYSVIALLMIVAVSLLWLPVLLKRPSGSLISSIPLLFAFSFLLPVIALLLYLHWGSGSKLGNYYAIKQQQNLVRRALTELKTPELVISKLKQRLQQDPNSAKGWYFLGRLYVSTGKYNDAAHAFVKAYQLNPNDINIFINYASVKYLILGHLPKAEYQQAMKLLQRFPQYPALMQLLAMDALAKHHYQQALAYWQRLLPLLPEDSKAYGEVVAQIDAVKQQVSTNPSPHLLVQVHLAKQLLSKVQANDTVFVYAKALQGPPMPVAIIRKQVKDLPFKVELTDANAMLSQHKLSMYKKVRIFARVSHSGEAFVKPGDLLAESQSITIAKQKQAIDMFINTTSGSPLKD